MLKLYLENIYNRTWHIVSVRNAGYFPEETLYTLMTLKFTSLRFTPEL